MPAFQGEAAPLTTLEYRVSGITLDVRPAAVSVPKGIAGSVSVTVNAGGATSGPAVEELTKGAYVEALLRGPGLPEPRRLIGPPNEPLLFPPLNLVGDYRLDAIRLVDAATGETRLEGSPSSIPVRVFDEVLVSRVTSRPLTLEEIQEKGIFIDESNFRAVEFEVGFVLDGKTIPIRFPVIAPKFTESTELIPAAELEAKLAQAAVLNRQYAANNVSLPPEFETANLDLQIQGINFQVVEDEGPEDLSLKIPPIPALLVIPGNIGFLNQFFSVQVFTENAAPSGSGLSVRNVQATLKLPAGPDRIPASSYDQPGDDPLRFARVGPDRIIEPTQQIKRPGPDGELGTADDVGVLRPSEAGQAEFLVEGLQEGLHVMDLDLEADLLGLAAGIVRVKGKAAGSVLVRNPRFSLAFSHPRTIRTGEPYEASVTVLNTGLTPANLLQITLNENSISGATLEPGQLETVELGNLLPGESATATFRLRAQRTGAISFSNLTTSEDSTVGRFRLSMGVDERGVALSPDTLALPDYASYLPPSVLAAATRVLGQALSVATAPQRPSGVLPVKRSTISRRALELAEAGQRLRYGDPLYRVLPDLLRDWQGGRVVADGFDQILRETNAGAEWRAALMAALEAEDGFGGPGRLVDRAPDLAGLSQHFAVAATDQGSLRADFGDGEEGATPGNSTQPYALGYPGANGDWVVTPGETPGIFEWTFPAAPPDADLAVALFDGVGQARQWTWTVSAPPVGAVYRFDPANPAAGLQVDLDGDGTVDTTLPGTETVVNELSPSLIAVEQDLEVLAGRGFNTCIGPEFANYGTVVAAVFSKPVATATAGDPSVYTLGGNNRANSVSIQPSGRVALLNLQKGISAIIPRTLTANAVTDARGNALTGGPMAVRSVYPGTNTPFTGGVAVSGRVIKNNGQPGAGLPVTLTMYDQVRGPFSCESWVRRVSQVITDSDGAFGLDFVMSGIPYSISVTDTSGLSDEALRVVMDSTVQSAAERDQIERLANSADTRDTLLGLFAAGSLPEAIAKVEGLDRAIVRDTVRIGSNREGQTVPFALRFRGRAAVVGTVVAADGETPIARAAVNLFPDPASREKGRGILTDSNGRFAFFGVPMGIYSIEVSVSDGRSRTVAGLIDEPGQVANELIAVPSIIVARATLRGRVFEADNETPHANGRVFIGQSNGFSVKDVVYIAEVDGEGFWEAPSLPVAEYDLVAVTFDGTRKGVRKDITPVAGIVTTANVTLESITRVFGRVQYADGRPAPNALVAGGISLVRTDVNGNFELEGVPVGVRTISAGLEKDPAAGIDFTRLGNQSLNVIAGEDNHVVVKLRAAGRIFGKVLNAQGDPMPGVRVAIPRGDGFYYTDADADGNYSFDHLGLGRYIVSAPSNATAPELDVQALNQQLRSGDEEQILAAFEEAARVFVGADDPLLTGEHRNFRPSSWGYSNANLQFDGQSVNADVRFIVQGTVSGTVLNHQGVPIGARVRLTGIGPSPAGEPVMSLRGERDSDPALGTFSFPGQLLAGPFTVQVASPFYPSVLKVDGFTTEIDPDATGLVLQFPPIQEVNGRIAGQVYLPDGSPAGEDVEVHINFSDDYVILTDTNGVFDTQIALPANRSYLVEARDPVSGLVGRSTVQMTAGVTNWVDVNLLTRDSTVTATVLRGNGLPAGGAQVKLTHGSFPFEDDLVAVADAAGRVSFTGLWEGKYALVAEYPEGSIRVCARDGGEVGPGETADFTLHLAGAGVIEGTFVKSDLVTPIEGAQVAIGRLGFATTDANGFFRFDGVPLATHRLFTTDPVTGTYATGSATVSAPDEVVTVQLVEAIRGEISGYVLNSFGTGYAAGAVVRVTFSDGITAARTVTTGPEGSFFLPGSPMGSFTLRATFTVPGSGRRVTGQLTGLLTETNSRVEVDVPLEPLGHLAIRVLRPDGITPADNIRVELSGSGVGSEQDTDAEGRVSFRDLPFRSYSIQAISRNGGELRSGLVTTVEVASRGDNPEVDLVLPGVGQINGQVLASDNSTPVPNAEITLRMSDAPFSGTTDTALTDASGRFSFTDVGFGGYRLTATSQSLASTLNGDIGADGEVDDVVLRLGDSGRIQGRLVRADGVTPVGGVDVGISYTSQSGNPGLAVFRTAADGLFEFDNVPVGDVHLSSVAPDFGGIIERDTEVTANGEVVDLGDVPFDEALPAVVEVNPDDTMIEVAITSVVELVFSEALDPGSIQSSGIFMRTGGTRTPATLSLLTDTGGVARIVRMVPDEPLVSEQTYEVVVVAGDIPAPASAFGPRDLVGRPLAAPFFSTFTTADNDPPVLLSAFPADGAVQIDPRAVPRLSFNEALISTGFTFTLTGPGGPVPGTASVGVNSQVLSFLPTGELQPNTTYSLSVSNVVDLAGNPAFPTGFSTTFHTLDTVGPVIDELRIADGLPASAGALVDIEAVLAASEPGASVRFTREFDPIGTSTNTPYRVGLTLPATGSVTIRAIATDRFGNDGPFAEQTFPVQVNQAPSVSYVQVVPASGPVLTGSSLQFDIEGSDDGVVEQLQISVGGAASLPVQTYTAATQRITVPVSTAAGPGDQVLITARAIDNAGLLGPPLSVAVETADGVLPNVVLLDPVDPIEVDVASTVTVEVAAFDAYGLASMEFQLTGALNQVIPLVIPVGATSHTGTVQVVIPAGLKPAGTGLQVRAAAEDAGGRRRTTSFVSWTIRDAGLPTVDIVAPAGEERFNPGDTLSVQLAVTDDVGVTRAEIAFESAYVTNVVHTVAVPETNGVVTVDIVLPPGPLDNRLRISATVFDGLEQGVVSAPVTIQILETDIRPPATRAVAVTDPLGGTSIDVSYEVTEGVSDLDHVELYFRRDGYGTFNRYLDPEGGAPLGHYLPPNGVQGTIPFDSTMTGGDGAYEFYTVGVDTTGNREAPPLGANTNVVPDQVQTFAVGTVWTEITADETIADGSVLYDDQNLRIRGATVTVVGQHTFRNVELLEGAVLTHEPATASTEPGLDIEAWSLTVDATSSIDVDGRGYLGGGSGDNPDLEGLTEGNVLGSENRAGGSYGGLGGQYAPGLPNPIYGNLITPYELGSGGGVGVSTSFPGGNGGGRIRMTVRHLVADGSITAGGAAGSGNLAGSGSGGAIQLNVGSLSGAGEIRADGGVFQVGGGGGRIAIHHVDLSYMDRQRIHALGGAVGTRSGANGTVFLQATELAEGTLIIDGQVGSGVFTGLPIPPGTTLQNLIIRNNARVEVLNPIVVNDSVEILSGSVLRHAAGEEDGLSIRARRVFVDIDSAIDVSGMGYRGGSNGIATAEGTTLAGQSGSAVRVGGAYGGEGSHFFTADLPGLVYGSPYAPVHLGSGGGNGSSASYPGGNGGGRVDIEVSESVVVDGEILADGAVGGGNNAGSGSGGAIWIRCMDLSGTGEIRARGGGFQIGGGGGRIAVEYEVLGAPGNNLDDLGNITAEGGKVSSRPGSAGTVLLKRSGQTFGDLVIDENRDTGTSTLWSPLTPVGFGIVQELTADTLKVDGAVPLLPGGLTGLMLQPNEQNTTLFEIIGNTATTITVRVDGPALTDIAAIGDRYAGHYRFDNLTVRRGAFPVLYDRLTVNETLHLTDRSKLTHADADIDFDPGLDITAEEIVVDAGAVIDVTARGYRGAWQGGNTSVFGRTLGNLPGAGDRVGAAFGGLGANAIDEPDTAYGNYDDVYHSGAGGGSSSSSYPGGNGGGRMHLQAGSMVVDGSLLADGGNGGGNLVGSGAGGGILLEVGDLSGSGTVTAHGGGSQTGGGGGRIAVRYDSMTMTREAFSAFGGAASVSGGNGTLFFHDQAVAEGDLVIDGGGVGTPLDGTPIGAVDDLANILIKGRAQVMARGAWNLEATLEVLSGSLLTHPDATLDTEPGLEISATRIVVGTNATIDVSGRGYRGAWQGGNTSVFGRTLGNLPGAGDRVGAAFGGLGAHAIDEPDTAYGNYDDVYYLGAGGGSSSFSYPGGNGGGRMHLQAGSMVVDGSLLADGGDGGGNLVGSGAGGGILLEVGDLSGSGTVTAHGGGYQTGGGGGRIAARYDVLSMDREAFSAFGGAASTSGGNGTLYFLDRAVAEGDLVVDGGGFTTPVDGTPVGAVDNLMHITLQRGARVLARGPWALSGNLELRDDSLLSNPQGVEGGLAVEAVNLTVDATSLIDVTGRGYLGGKQPGNPDETGDTVDLAEGSGFRAGGSYGGLGATFGDPPNPVYGDPGEPAQLGSGGGSFGGFLGGNGGGRVVLILSDTTVIDGAIRANGAPGKGNLAGSGSGGSVFLVSPMLHGAGSITANGGGYQTGGGGGRVAVYSDSGTFDPGQIFAAGGVATRTGSPGTVVVDTVDVAVGLSPASLVTGWLLSGGATSPSSEEPSIAGAANVASSSVQYRLGKVRWVSGRRFVDVTLLGLPGRGYVLEASRDLHDSAAWYTVPGTRATCGHEGLVYRLLLPSRATSLYLRAREQ